MTTIPIIITNTEFVAIAEVLGEDADLDLGNAEAPAIVCYGEFSRARAAAAVGRGLHPDRPHEEVLAVVDRIQIQPGSDVGYIYFMGTEVANVEDDEPPADLLPRVREAIAEVAEDSNPLVPADELVFARDTLGKDATAAEVYELARRRTVEANRERMRQ